ncbi:MAG TPA: Druantia anti-phage system protein DruA [Dehalococcoidia bacterium]|nr:Druantia anti-phage system protein DruA [Dehalococcoidia bacterium]
MGEDTWNFVGHTVRTDELDLIRSIVDEFSGLSRVELASTVCELLGWTRATGRLKARECRDLLERLEAAEAIRLPAKRVGRPAGAHTRVPVTKRGDVPALVTGTVHDLAPIAIERVTTTDDRLLFRELVGRHHYLGHATPFGAHLRYLIYAARPERQVVACMQFSSAAWRLTPRDAWIGWDEATRVRHLPQVINNSRFLVLPWISAYNLASTILSRVARQVVPDWATMYGVTPVLLETLVDPRRFDGASYRAANWRVVGTTTGRGRNDRHRRVVRVPKRVLIYPLVPDTAERLRGH